MPVDTYSAEERGEENTDTYQVFLKDSDGPISPFHDIPLVANSETNTFHIVVEIPRWTNAKMEIDTKSPLHPIVQVKPVGQLAFKVLDTIFVSGPEERQAEVCGQQLPSPWLYLELWSFSSNLGEPKPQGDQNILIAAADNNAEQDESTQANGDNDPVDCCEIGHRVAKRGDVLEVGEDVRLKVVVVLSFYLFM